MRICSYALPMIPALPKRSGIAHRAASAMFAIGPASASYQGGNGYLIHLDLQYGIGSFSSNTDNYDSNIDGDGICRVASREPRESPPLLP